MIPASATERQSGKYWVKMSAGDDGAAEFGVLYGGEKHDLAARVRGQFRDQYTCNLSHSFDDQDARTLMSKIDTRTGSPKNGECPQRRMETKWRGGQ